MERPYKERDENARGEAVPHRLKGRGDENAICLHFLPYVLDICRKFAFLISQGSVATCLGQGG